MINKNHVVNNRKGIYVIIIGIVYYILVSIIPFISRVISTYLSTYLSVLVFVGLFILLVGLIPLKQLLYIVLLLGFLLFELVNITINEISSLPLFAWRTLNWVLPVLFSIFLLRLGNKKIIRVVLIVLLGGLFLTSLTSIYGLETDPLAARFLATSEASTSESTVSLQMRNIGGFSIVYSTVLLYPMVTCLYKFKKINLMSFVLLTIVFGLFIYYSQYFYASLLFAVSMLLFILPKRFTLLTLLLIFLVVVFVGFIFPDVIVSVIYELADNMNAIYLSRRLRAIGRIIEDRSLLHDEIYLREAAYRRSLDTFLEYPLFGVWLATGSDVRAGTHSFILDFLANFGVIGLSVLGIFYGFLYKIFYAPMKKQPQFGFMIYSFTLFIIIGFINPIDSLSITGFAVPLIGYLCLPEKNHLIVAEKQIAEQMDRENLLSIM
jgi:O-antigen ligase